MAVAQVWPMASFPQLFAVQAAGDVQSALDVHVVLQAVPFEAQPQGSQSVEVTVLQLPAPSQVRAGVNTSPLRQVEATQTVPLP